MTLEPESTLNHPPSSTDAQIRPICEAAARGNAGSFEKCDTKAPQEPSVVVAFSSPAEVFRVFCSRGRRTRYDRCDAATVFDWLQRGWLKCERAPLPAAPLGSHVVRSQGEESVLHREMKAAAALWLHKAGYSDYEFEARLFFGQVDLFVGTAGIAVECGGTTPDRAFHVFHGHLRQPVVVPFPGDSAYIFTRTNAGQIPGEDSLRAQQERMDAAICGLRFTPAGSLPYGGRNA